MLPIEFQRFSVYKIILEVHSVRFPLERGLGACPTELRGDFLQLKPSRSLETSKVKKKGPVRGLSFYRINNNSLYFTNGQLSSSTSNSSLSTA